MHTKSILIALLICTSISAQNSTLLSQDITINKHVDGTLLLPNNVEHPPLTILIAGSGPTDRDGNQNFLKNNSLKKLAESLGKQGIATFRYDKRVVKQIRQRNISNDILFDDFITDAISVIRYFKEKYSYNKIHIIGHSQGSLVGMLAAHNESIDGYISLAGAGKTIDEVITDQIIRTAPGLKEDTERIFALLKEGQFTDDFPLALASIFNQDVQPFISNWMQYNPQEIISTLKIPILIINGTKDLQVYPDEASLLHDASPNSELMIIEKMNHILVPIEGDDLENSKSYNESQRELSIELVKGISNFILKNQD